MRTEGGFSLIEILVALALIAGGLLAIATMSVTSLQSVDLSGDETTAMILSQQRMEWLRSQGYAAAAANAGTTTETLAGAYAGYTRISVIVDDSPIPEVKTVTVTTTSPSGRQVAISSLLAE